MKSSGQRNLWTGSIEACCDGLKSGSKVLSVLLLSPKPEDESSDVPRRVPGEREEKGSKSEDRHGQATVTFFLPN